MRTAVILSGQTRTFKRCLPSLHWQVFRKFENPEFYASVAADADAEDIELLRKQYPNAKVCIEKVEQPLLPEPPAHLANHAPYAISSPIQGILRQLWHLSRAWRFAASNGATECDIVVRCRPDLHFHKFEMPPIRLQLRSNTEFEVFAVESRKAYTPYWGTYSGCNDRFAVMSRDAAPGYFRTWDSLPEMLDTGMPLHPETAVHHSLTSAGVTICPTLKAEFAALRPNGQLVHMVVLPGELAAYTAHLSKIA